tara:strand:+ start:107 stop:400 length:294 start_codon:yes stop_codon:yes gene_type:complete
MATIISQSISDTDMLLLKNDLYDENNPNNPAQLWADNMVIGKINNCYKRLKNEWVPILMDDTSVMAISASKDEFVQQVVNHSTYKNRYHREVSGSLD